MKSFPVVFSTVIICAAASHVGAQVLSNELRAGKHTVQAVVVMPAHVRLATSRFQRAQNMAAEEEKAAEALYAAVCGELELRQVKALPAPGDQATLAAIWNDYASIAPQLAKMPGGVTKGRFNIGDRLAGYAPAGAELALFIDGSGFLPSRRKVVHELTVYVSGWGPFLHGYLTFVDPRTGEVVAFCKYTLKGDPSSERSIPEMRARIRQSMRKLPFQRPADAAGAVYESSSVAKK